MIGKVHAIPPGSGDPRTMLPLLKRYDFAIASNPSDRSTICALAGGRRSYVFSYKRRQDRWREWLSTRCRFYDDRVHIVPLILSQLEPLGIPPVPEVSTGYGGEDARLAAAARDASGSGPYVVFHPWARKGYKCWKPEEWARLASLVRERTGAQPLVTVSPDPADRPALDRILSRVPPGAAAPLPGVLPLGALAALLAGSLGYVGVDTVVTHMAASLDVPTVALFGPTPTHHWGPWPNGHAGANPYSADGGIQRHGSVTVVQRDWPCVPCNRESCGRTGGGGFDCMDRIDPTEVFDELERLIRRGRTGGRDGGSPGGEGRTAP
jgi:heptosyltransferase-3